MKKAEVESRAARYSNSPPVYYIPFAIAPLRYTPASNATHTRAYTRVPFTLFIQGRLFPSSYLWKRLRACVCRDFWNLTLRFVTCSISAELIAILVAPWFVTEFEQPWLKYLQSARQLAVWNSSRTFVEFSSRNSIDTFFGPVFSPV